MPLFHPHPFINARRSIPDESPLRISMAARIKFKRDFNCRSLIIHLFSCESVLCEHIEIQTVIRTQSCLVCARAARRHVEIPTQSAKELHLRQTHSRYPRTRWNVLCSCLRHLAHRYAFFEGTHVGPDVQYTLDDNLAPLNLMRSINDDSDGVHSSRNRGN